MNTEVFAAVFAALVAFRVVAPLIDALNPFSIVTKSKGRRNVDAIQGFPSGPKAGAGRGN